MRATKTCFVAATCLACQATPVPAQATASPGPYAASDAVAPAQERGCAYEARLLPPADALELEVSVRCQGWRVEAFVLHHPQLRKFVHRVQPSAAGQNKQSSQFPLTPGEDVQLSYRVRIAEAGKQLGKFNQALFVGGQTLAPLGSWLLAPVPDAAGASATLQISDHPELRFDTGLRQKNGRYEFSVREIRVGSYGAFGTTPPQVLRLQQAELKEDQTPTKRQATATLRLAVLAGKYKVSEEELTTWVRDAAAAVANFYAGFPAREAFIAVVPVPGKRGVRYGQLLPASGPGIVLLLGEETHQQELYDDWILVHELFHLGVPSFVDEGKWLDEGLATYFEPIIRMRAGWLTEREVWDEFARDMPQGLAAAETYGLARGRDYKDRYWGGALFVFLADLEAARSAKRNFQSALVAALARGAEAPVVWDLKRYMELLDRQMGVRVMGQLAEAHAFSGSKTYFEQRLAQLGVIRSPLGVLLDDEAELAHVRRQLVCGENCRND